MSKPSLVEFERRLHVKFINSLDSDQSSFEYFMSVPMRMGGCYWAVTAAKSLAISIGDPIFEKARDFVLSCYNTDGGFSVDVGHDSSITATHYALLVVSQTGGLKGLVCHRKTWKFLRALQLENGSFSGDRWGETDLRFAYDAIAIACILGESKCDESCQYCRCDECEQDASIRIPDLCSYVLSCRNSDGAFAPSPGGESHAAYTYCALASLDIAHLCFGMSEIATPESTAFWLASRQTAHGGFNGRPEKAPDVCYSWWIYASLKILDFYGLGKPIQGELVDQQISCRFSSWISKSSLVDFILKAQDLETGGVSDRPGYAPDIFHTFFGIAALSLLEPELGLDRIDPTFAVPESVAANWRQGGMNEDY